MPIDDGDVFDGLHSKREKTLCGLAFDPESRRWVGEAWRLFRPEGLLITNAPAGAQLVDWTQGNERVFPIGPVPVPLDLFVIMELRPETRPSYPTLELGQRISLAVIDGVSRSTIGPPMTLTVWGWSAR